MAKRVPVHYVLYLQLERVFNTSPHASLAQHARLLLHIEHIVDSLPECPIARLPGLWGVAWR
jgi:hypothetical protein